MSSAAPQPFEPTLVPAYEIKGGLRKVFENLRHVKPLDSKAIDEAETEAFAVVEQSKKSRDMKSVATRSLDEARAHFAIARARLAKGERWEAILDELEAAVMPILERHEARITALEATVGSQQSTIGTQQQELGENKMEIGTLNAKVGTLKAKVGTLEATVGNTEALLDLRQCSMFLQPEFTTDFLKETKKFVKLGKEERRRLIALQPAIYRLINTFGRDGGDFVHHRRTIIASKLKEYILEEYKDMFAERDVDQFLVYFNTVLRRTRKDSTIDVYKQSIELGTKDMRDDE